jgi:hypothetical protein
MARSVWDSLDTELVSDSEPVRPLWTLEKEIDNHEAVLKWAEGVYSAETKRARSYRQTAIRNLQIYKGKFTQDAGRENPTQANQLGFRPPKAAKLIVNHLQDLVVQKVSRAIKNKPSVVISPANPEYSDRVAAKIVKAWTDYQLYRIDFDAIITEVLTSALIMGEAYLAVQWDPNAGEVLPAWAETAREAKAAGKKPRLTIQRNGEQLELDSPVNVGDIGMGCRTPLNTLVELCGNFNRARYVIFEDLHDLDELRKLYPNAKELQKDASLKSWAGSNDLSGESLGNKVLVRSMYWKGDAFMPRGRYIRWTAQCVLENDPLPEGCTDLPVVRFSDIDVPNEQRGMSFFTHGRALNATINDLTSLIRRNAVMMSHPKWLVPRGSKIKRESIGNDISIVEFDGPNPPKVEAAPPLSQEIIQLRNELRNDLQTILGTSDTARGNPPPNVRSALAMQALDEQEEQRANSGVAKYAALVRESIKKALVTAAAYYEPDDKRMIPIVGKDSAFLLKEFDVSTLSRGYDVRVTSNTGLPSGKSLRTQTLIELKQAFPTALRDEMVLDMLQIGDSEKFFDKSTVALKAASAENEAMLAGEDIADPVPYENLLIHWNSHVLEMQSRGYKAALPQAVQKRFEVHTGGTEYLMIRAARRNPAFAIELCKLPQFPMFAELTEQDYVLLDRARTGNPLALTEIHMLYTTGQLPAQPGQPPQAGGPITPATGNLGGNGGEQGGRPPAEVGQEGQPANTQTMTPEQAAAAEGATTA